MITYFIVKIWREKKNQINKPNRDNCLFWLDLVFNFYVLLFFTLNKLKKPKLEWLHFYFILGERKKKPPHTHTHTHFTLLTHSLALLFFFSLFSYYSLTHTFT